MFIHTPYGVAYNLKFNLRVKELLVNSEMKTSLSAGTELKIFAIFVKSESGKSSWSLSNPAFKGFGFDDGLDIFPIVPKLRNFRFKLVEVTESRTSGLNRDVPLGHFRFR